MFKILKLSKRNEIDICYSGKQALDRIQHSIKWQQQDRSSDERAKEDEIINTGCAQSSYSLIMVEIALPSMDGLELVKSIKQTFKEY